MLFRSNNWDKIFAKSPQEVDDAKAEDEAFNAIKRYNDDPFGPPPSGGMSTQQGEALGTKK